MCKDCKCVKLEPIKVWFSIHDGGDGSAYPHWLLTEEAAEYDQDHLDQGWGEPCLGSVETYKGSDIHLTATKNDMKSEIKKIVELLKEEKNSFWFQSLVERYLTIYDKERGFINYQNFRSFLKMDEEKI